MSRVMVFSRDGRYLTDLRVSVTRSWVLNGIGQADFTIGITDPKCLRKYLEFGNFLLIQHESLPDWVGVIDTPRAWSKGQVSVRAYEALQLLTWRRTQSNLLITGSAGTIFVNLVAMANAADDTRIRSQIISGDGTQREETLGDDIFTHVDRVRSRANNDIILTPDLSTRRLLINAAWISRAGTDQITELVEGKNLESGSESLVEDGVFSNDLLGEGDGGTEETRVTSVATNQTSINQFGRRQGKVTFDGNSNQGTLDSNTLASVTINGVPLRLLTVVVLDVGNIFKKLRLGSTFPTRLVRAGFTGDAPGMKAVTRIYGMRFADGANRCEILTQDGANGQF